MKPYIKPKSKAEFWLWFDGKGEMPKSVRRYHAKAFRKHLKTIIKKDEND